MTIDVSAERLMLDERMGLLNAGVSVDGEEVMARLIGEIDERGPLSGAP